MDFVKRYSQNLADVQNTVQRMNSNTKGFIFWIDYTINPELPPPVISTIAPEVINPKDIWMNHKHENTMQTLLEEREKTIDELVAVDEAADQEEAGVEKLVDQLTHIAIESEDEADIYGEIVATKAQKANFNAAHEAKKKEHNKRAKEAKVKRSEIIIIVNALANIRSAAKHMMSKVNQGLIKCTDFTLDRLSYDNIYDRKILSASCLAYVKSKLEVASILQKIDDEIKAEPAFEWLPRDALTPDQIACMDDLALRAADEAESISAVAKIFCVRKKEQDKGNYPLLLYT